ncbi:MAG: aminotransferase class III-fold pyridoxal phosphate-dependent enzyme [Bdellovibrionales bacterium]
MSGLLGQQLMASGKINETVETLVAEAQRLSENIKTVRGPQPEHQANFNKLLERTNQLRGRPLYYNYLGSGIGRGPYVELEDGSVKLDLVNGIGVHILGHSHPKVIKAGLKGALSDIVMQGHLQANQDYTKLAGKLVDLASKKSRLRHAWLTSCGTMANENALKICRQKKTPARMIMTFENAFAGRSTMMAEVTDNPAFKQGLPEYHEVLRLPFYDKNDPDKTLRAMKEHVAKHAGNICCFVFEPMLGEGGYRTGTREFFLPLMQFCREQKIPIWADEIQTFSRTGNFFAFETYGFGDYVDVCTVAKTVQNGATLYTEEYNPQAGLIAGTFAGPSSALSAGLAVLEELDSGGYMGPGGKVEKIHKEFVAMLNRLNETSCKGLLQEAGGVGLLVAVTPLDGSQAKQGQLLKAMFNNGLMSFGCGRNPWRVRFLLPAILQSADIELAGQLIEKSILECV